MNILAIPTTYGLSKPISGGQNRFFNLIKVLKKKGNRITVLESESLFDQNDNNIAKIYLYKDYKIFNRTLTIFRDLNVDFILKLLKIIKNEQIDLIQVTHPSGLLMATIISKLTRKKILLVYDAHNVESFFIKETFVNNQKYSKLEKSTISIYTTYLEKIVCKYIVNHITSVSNKDRSVFIKKYNLNMEKVSVVPSGCSIHKVIDKKCKNDIKKENGISNDKLIIFFHGLFSHPSNKEAFQIIENYVAPKFEEKYENVLFVVGGTGFPKFERANIKSIGFIDNLYEFISTVDIAIVPLTTGAGTKLKILDYMVTGLPIVTTKKGIDGINAENGKHSIVINDVDDEFIDAIKYLIDNEEERKRIGANARMLAEEEYDWNQIGEKLDGIYNRALTGTNNGYRQPTPNE